MLDAQLQENTTAQIKDTKEEVKELISLTKEIAPLNSRSLVLGQTSNYEVFFKKMNIFSNINVYTKYDKFDPYVDNIVYMFLIPDIEKRMGTTIDYFGINKEMFKLTSHEKYDIYRLIEDSGTRIFGSVPYFVEIGRAHV